jgi:fumarate reductase subunit D
VVDLMDDERIKIPSSAEDRAASPSERSRWIAATSYLAFLCFFSLWRSKDDPFIRYHARQGFLLLLGECVVIVATLILEVTIGKLKLIGMLVIVLFRLVVGLGALTLSVVGFVKALFGEYWHLPFLGDYREKVPGLHVDEK